MQEKKRTVWNFFDRIEGDKVVWIISLMLILISIVCIFSSTSRLLRGSQTRLDLVRNQLFVVAGGIALILICYNIRNLEFFRRVSKWGFFISLALLLPLVAKVDTTFIKSVEINGARRILQLGRLQIHVYEVVKVAMVMYTAWAMDALKRGKLKGPGTLSGKKILNIYAPYLIVCGLTALGSNSAAILLGALLFIVMLLGGANFKELFLTTMAAAVVGGGTLLITNGGRLDTLKSRFQQNEKYYEMKADAAPAGSQEFYDAIDKIRQQYSARIAIKQGGILGKGPGQSTQRYVVPDYSEDFMYSFIVEEYGLWGALAVIILYVSLMARGSIIARNCGRDLFAKLAVAGLCLLITGQAFLHMLVNADMAPMTGQTLPLISHGNSAFLCFSLAFGIILSFSRIAQKRIEREAQQLVESNDNVKAGLEELDEFENSDEDGIQ